MLKQLRKEVVMKKNKKKEKVAKPRKKFSLFSFSVNLFIPFTIPLVEIVKFLFEKFCPLGEFNILIEPRTAS